MNATDLQQTGREMSAARMRVPLPNRPKFDIESKEYFNAIGGAIRAGDLDRAARLLHRWNERVEWLTQVPRCCVAPPCLIRRTGESISDYIERCHMAAERRR